MSDAQRATADVSVCIVNWNGLQVLRNCLLSLRTGNELLSLQVIVVDNASTDGSVAMMRGEFPEVVLVCNDDNRGFAAGNNQAAAKATGRYLFFLNNDTIVQPASLSQLVQFLDGHPEVVAVGPRLMGSDGKPQRSGRNLPTLRAMLHAGVLPIRWTKVFSRRYRTYRDAFDPAVSGPVPQLAAAAMMVRPESFHQAGAWDEAFEFGVEDVDLCVRLGKFGQVYYLAEPWITHLGRVSSHLDRGRVFRSYQCGHVRYFRKHHRSPLAPLIYKIAITIDTPIRLLMLLCKTALSALTGRREEAARSRQRAAGVWFFVCHGLIRFWLT
jgi:GT2 family glycosyltransferase